jgi:hypothetical protein
MPVLQEIDTLKKRIDALQVKQKKAETDVAVHEGKLSTLMDMLREEFKVDSIEAAQELLESMTSQISAKETELKNFIVLIEEKVKEMEGG